MEILKKEPKSVQNSLDIPNVFFSGNTSDFVDFHNFLKLLVNAKERSIISDEQFTDVMKMITSLYVEKRVENKISDSIIEKINKFANKIA